MKTILLGMAAILSALAVQDDNTSKESEAWQIFARAGKGVWVAKVKKEEAMAFVFFPATNRVRPTSTFNSAGTWFSSLDTAVTFVKKKPASISFGPAAPGSLADDAKILSELSPMELKALIEAADASVKKAPNQSSEPTAGLRPAAHL